MNIMIVSRDRFFISGVIALIAQVWRPDSDSHPVFMAAEENQPLLLPDVVITDIAAAEKPLGEKNDPSQEPAVKIFLAALYRAGKQTWCPGHHIILGKKEAAKQLACLFGNKSSALFLPPISLPPGSMHRVSTSALSKQQAMVLKYIRQRMSLTDISRITRLSVKTISTHKRAIMRKLGMKNNGEFYQYAFSDLGRQDS